MELTIRQMQRQLFIAYQMTKNKMQMQLHFSFDAKGEPSIDVWFHREHNKCVNITIYEFFTAQKKTELFKKAIACINGDMDPFEEEK